MIVRARRMQKLHIDDYFLILAILTLICSFGLMMAGLSNLYLFDDVLAGKALPPTDLIQIASNAALYFCLEKTFTWTTIYVVKFSFLFVFRSLVRRIKAPEILWWFTSITCVPIACISITAPWIMCPYAGAALLSE